MEPASPRVKKEVPKLSLNALQQVVPQNYFSRIKCKILIPLIPVEFRIK